MQLAISWQQGLDVEIVSCMDHRGQLHVFSTGFDGLREEEGPEREEHEQFMLNLLVHQAIQPSVVRQALMDLRNAIR